MNKVLTNLFIGCTANKMEKIEGPGKIIEADESEIGKLKFNCSHWVEGQWIFGGIKCGSGCCFMVAVHDRTADTLLGLIKLCIKPGTLVISHY